MSQARKIVAQEKGLPQGSINNDFVLKTGMFQIKRRPTNDNPAWELVKI